MRGYHQSDSYDPADAITIVAKSLKFSMSAHRPLGRLWHEDDDPLHT